MSWTREQAKTLAERILALSKAGECEVTLRASQDGHTRFAANEITTAGMIRNVSISITSAATQTFGVGKASTFTSAFVPASFARRDNGADAIPAHVGQGHSGPGSATMRGNSDVRPRIFCSRAGFAGRVARRAADNFG